MSLVPRSENAEYGRRMQPEFFQNLLIRGHASLENFWTVAELSELRVQDSKLRDSGSFRPGKIGHTTSSAHDPSQRSDSICWLSSELKQTEFIFEKLESLRLLLNQELQLGMFRLEGHFAHYPEGTRYRRHLDVHPSQCQSAGGRVLSMISYLHSDWEEGMGGELVLYPEDKSSVRIAPLPGRTVFFLSESIEHEVLQSHFDRRSLAFWFHRR